MTLNLWYSLADMNEGFIVVTMQQMIGDRPGMAMTGDFNLPMGECSEEPARSMASSKLETLLRLNAAGEPDEIEVEERWVHTSPGVFPEIGDQEFALVLQEMRGGYEPGEAVVYTEVTNPSQQAAHEVFGDMVRRATDDLKAVVGHDIGHVAVISYGYRDYAAAASS